MSTFTGTARAGRQREKRAASRLHWGVTLALAFCVVLPQAQADERPTFPDLEPDTLELVPYQSPEYRFQVVPLDEEPPVGFEQPGFDDTGFETGTAAFGGGSGGAGSGIDCPLQNTVVTEWPVNTQLLVRRTVSIPEGVANLRVMVSIDNDILDVFFNGSSITDFTTHDDCPILDEFRFDVPPDLVQPGENLLVFHVLDRGIENFFDARILAELSPAQLVQQLSQLVTAPQAPLVPISDVSVDSRIVARGEGSSTIIRYVVSGTGEPGEVRIEQTAEAELSVEFLLDGERIAVGTSTPEETVVVRSPEAVQRLAELDPGILSIAAVFAGEVARRRPQPVQPQLSCRSRCDRQAALDAAFPDMAAGFLKARVSGGNIQRDGPLTSLGAAFASHLLGAAAEAETLLRIERVRQQCLVSCAPDLVPEFLQCGDDHTFGIRVRNEGGEVAPASNATLMLVCPALQNPTNFLTAPPIGPGGLHDFGEFVLSEEAEREPNCREFEFTVDTDNTVIEGFEGNNTTNCVLPR